MYVAHFYCDRCKDHWKIFYRNYEDMKKGDACQVCTDDLDWGTDKEVIVETHFFEFVDEG